MSQLTPTWQEVYEKVLGSYSSKVPVALTAEEAKALVTEIARLHSENNSMQSVIRTMQHLTRSIENFQAAVCNYNQRSGL